MRLGLLGMAGVRVVDPELLELGLTLPGFVERGRAIAALPSLGLLTLAALVPDGVEVEVRDVEPGSEDRDLPGEYDAVALSFLAASAAEAYALADRYRAAGTRVVLGGLHASACPDEAARHADAVVVGEGEPLWPRVVDDLRRGRLAPRYGPAPEPFDLARAPLPRFDLLGDRAVDRYTVQTQRGCPWACDFCAASLRIAPRFTTKPVAKVVAELERVRELADRPFVEFADDNTFADKAHGRRLLDAVAPLGLRWFTETDASVADDPELVARLRDAGCAQLLIGLEHPDAAPLAGVERRADWKARRADRALASVQRLQEAGVSVVGCFVLGLEGASGHSASQGEVDRLLAFVRASGLHQVQVTVRTPFPGTPLFDSLAAAGRLLPHDTWRDRTLFDVTFEPERGVAALRASLHRAVRELYSEAATVERRRAFRAALRRGARARR